MKTPSLLSLVLLSSLTLSAPAAVLPVGNPSFETPSLAANAVTSDLTSSWDLNGGPVGGSFIERIPGFASQGVNHLGMNSWNSVTHRTAHVFQSNTVYTLTVAVGNRAGQTVAGNASTYELTAGTLALGVSASVDASIAVPAGQFVDAPPLTLSTALLPDLVGKSMQINLIAFGEGRSHFDNIRLETTSRLVTNNDGSGPGSLRRAIDDAANGDTILFDPAFFNGEAEDAIVLASELSIGDKTVTIDARNIACGVTVSGNDAVRCFRKYGSGALTLRGLTLTGGRTGGDGGGIYSDGTTTLLMESCTVRNCTAAGWGGGVDNAAQATLINCTIAANSANFGGGVLNLTTGTLTLRHCTITGNDGTTWGGGLMARGTVTVENCIIASNVAATGPDLNLETATFTRAGHNLIGSNASIESIFPAGNPNANGDRAGTPAAPLNPLLSAPAFNGGTGLTRLPLPGSPVIDAGLSNAATPATDQRGAVRTQGSALDLGAAEVEWCGGVTTSAPRLTGLWLFDDSTSITRASVGNNLAVGGTAPAWSMNQADDSGKLLRGVITTVGGTANRLAATHGIPSNGGGLFVNRYTLLMDILSPPASRSSFRSLLQTTALNSDDTDYFISWQGDVMGNGTIGFAPSVDESRWQRIVITVQNGTSLQTWVNGTFFHTHTAGTVDGRMSLEATALFFADDNAENAPLHAGAIAMWNGALSSADIAALGGPGDPIPPDGQITTPVDEVTALPFADNSNGEGVDKALDDDTGTKYHNRQKLNTGLEIVPALGVTRLTGLRLISANDEPDRDPATFTVLGRSGDRPWLPIAAGMVPAFSGRFTTQEFRFTSAVPACDRYQLLFPSLASANADAMQIAEVDLLGAPVDRTPRITKLAYRGVGGNNNHRFTVVWAADPYAPYGLQSSPNLQQPWTLFATDMRNSNAAGYQAFTIPASTPRQFFRVLRER